jgi:hypothetical protein
MTLIVPTLARADLATNVHAATAKIVYRVNYGVAVNYGRVLIPPKAHKHTQKKTNVQEGRTEQSTFLLDREVPFLRPKPVFPRPPFKALNLTLRLLELASKFDLFQITGVMAIGHWGSYV